MIQFVYSKVGSPWFVLAFVESIFKRVGSWDVVQFYIFYKNIHEVVHQESQKITDVKPSLMHHQGLQQRTKRKIGKEHKQEIVSDCLMTSLPISRHPKPSSKLDCCFTYLQQPNGRGKKEVIHSRINFLVELFSGSSMPFDKHHKITVSF